MVQLMIAVLGIIGMVAFVGLGEWLYENRVDLLSKEVDQD
jgi:hypothetical protein